jgi:hypothetical protein
MPYFDIRNSLFDIRYSLFKSFFCDQTGCFLAGGRTRGETTPFQLIIRPRLMVCGSGLDPGFAAHLESILSRLQTAPTTYKVVSYLIRLDATPLALG